VRSTLVVPALLALLACTPKQPDQPEQPAPPDPILVVPVVEPDEGKPVVAGEVKLSPLEKEVTVPVGTTLLYSFESHASVGLGASQTVADAAVVKYVRTDTAYEQSDEQREGKTGADAATGTFVFEAVGPGTTTVTVDELMRGTTEQSATFTITVTEK
jgi:hypothetical protein